MGKTIYLTDNEFSFISSMVDRIDCSGPKYFETDDGTIILDPVLESLKKKFLVLGSIGDDVNHD